MAAAVVLLLTAGRAAGHGRLIEPPSRSTMWRSVRWPGCRAALTADPRYGFDTPPNYNDHESYCGGFTRQWQTNGGKCGICGDAWDLPQVGAMSSRPFPAFPFISLAFSGSNPGFVRKC
jgi:hypothetical protein